MVQFDKDRTVRKDNTNQLRARTFREKDVNHHQDRNNSLSPQGRDKPLHAPSIYPQGTTDNSPTGANHEDDQDTNTR